MKRVWWKTRDTTRDFMRGFSANSKRLMPHKESILDVSEEDLREMFCLHEKGVPIAKGMFICTVQGGGEHAAPHYIAVDNTTGDMWEKEFYDSFSAEKWLMRESGSY